MNRIKIAISTNKLFYEKSLEIIIKSLLESGIDKTDINVFNAGFDEHKTYVINDITYHEIDHNSYEYSPLIEISNRELESDYWFLIHDTCKVGVNFKNLLHNIPVNNPDKIALKSCPSMSIGLYKYTYLLNQKDKLNSIKNKDYSRESMMYWKLWGVPNEDYIMWKTDPMPLIYNNIDRWEVTSYENWYGTNTIRRTEYYPSLDLYKNKSNWGQTGNNMIIEI